MNIVGGRTAQPARPRPGRGIGFTVLPLCITGTIVTSHLSERLSQGAPLIYNVWKVYIGETDIGRPVRNPILRPDVQHNDVLPPRCRVFPPRRQWGVEWRSISGGQLHRHRRYVGLPQPYQFDSELHGCVLPEPRTGRQLSVWVLPTTRYRGYVAVIPPSSAWKPAHFVNLQGPLVRIASKSGARVRVVLTRDPHTSGP